MKESISKKSTADYSTPSRRRQLVKERFSRVVDAFEAAGRIDALWETERRKKALLTFMEEASGKYKSYVVENVEETFTEFETSNLSMYSLLDENYDFTLAAALWILDELNLSQKLAKELGLPENEEVLMAMDLGYAAEGAGPLPNHESRKELSETVTYM